MRKQQARQGGTGGGTSGESDRAFSRAMARVDVCSCPACSQLRRGASKATTKAARRRLLKRWACEG